MREYFERFQSANGRAESRSQQVENQITPAGASSEEVLAAYVLFLEESLAISEDFLDDVETLDPPNDAQAAHDDYVTSARILFAAFEEAINDVRDAGTADDAVDVLIGAIEQPAADLGTRCTSLQEIADDQNIEAELRCGD